MLKMNKTSVPKAIVDQKVAQWKENFAQQTGKKPDEKQCEKIRETVVNVAKKLNRDGGVK